MIDKHPKHDSRNRLAAVVALIVTMTVIVSLWVVLLPGQLDLNGRELKSSSFWDNLKSSGQETIDNWDQTTGLIHQSWDDTIQEGVEEARSAQVKEVMDENQEDIDKFRQKLLEQATIEKSDITQP